MPFVIHPGKPFPYGASRSSNTVNFAVYSNVASGMVLCLYDLDRKLLAEIALDPDFNRTGAVWHVEVEEVPDPCAYAYKVEGNTAGECLVDPYAREILGRDKWGDKETKRYAPLGLIFPSREFDWQGVVSPRIPREDLIVYEMHVRGFTADPSSKVEYPGTYRGLIEKIPYLVDLGVNAVELLPIQEFNELENHRIDPISRHFLVNFWGYSTVNFFSPMRRYSSRVAPGDPTEEFQTLVRELHRNGIMVILDVVFNHTAEGNSDGPTYSFRGLDESTYYILDSNGSQTNFSGCGNTFNCNHPVPIRLILEALRYWSLEIQVDGFRFDLASIFKRGQDGDPIYPSPLIDAISQDPLLKEKILIAEPWDAAGMYDVGNFYRRDPRWGEWNGKYRDSVRQFMKGIPRSKGEFVTRISGSQDLYYGLSPLCSLNFITCHDGFTLNDLVSYNDKHNQSNGEENRDGTNDNESWNCGEEGSSKNKKVLSIRQRQIRNFMTCLMLSQGVPMIFMGDEYAHTKSGNNNSWCHDSPLNWFLWDKIEENQGLVRFCKMLIAFRKAHSLLRRSTFLTGDDVLWHGAKPLEPNWNKEAPCIAFTLIDHEKDEDIYAAINACPKDFDIILPNTPDNHSWHCIVNTANPSPKDIVEESQSTPIPQAKMRLPAYSSVVLKSIA